MSLGATSAVSARTSRQLDQLDRRHKLEDGTAHNSNNARAGTHTSPTVPTNTDRKRIMTLSVPRQASPSTPRRSCFTGAADRMTPNSSVLLSHRVPVRVFFSLASLAIFLVVCSCWCGAVASASSVFVGPSGLLVDSPLQLQGVDVGDAITSLRSELTSLKATVIAQAESITSLQVESASLRTDLTATEAIIAAQAESIAALTAEVVAINSTVTDISDLTGTTTIVIVVNGLRRLTAAIDATVANQTAALTSLSSSLTQVESLTGDSLLVSTIVDLISTTTSLTSTVDAIADLTGSSTIVTTIESIMDSMTDLATDIATLQTLETATTQMLTTLSQTVTAQVTLINNKIDEEDAALQAEISALNTTLTVAVTTLQVRATEDETDISALQTLTATHTIEITDLQTLTTTHTNEITALQTTTGSLSSASSTYSNEISSLQSSVSSLSSSSSSVTSGLWCGLSTLGSVGNWVKHIACGGNYITEDSSCPTGYTIVTLEMGNAYDGSGISNMGMSCISS